MTQQHRIFAMGMNQPFTISAGWTPAADLLDRRFPLAEGSHRDAADYVIYHDHLMVIDREGRCSGLARPAQFVDAGGFDEAPRSVLLEQDGLQVEIEPQRSATGCNGAAGEHRLQLLTALAAA